MHICLTWYASGEMSGRLSISTRVETQVSGLPAWSAMDTYQRIWDMVGGVSSDQIGSMEEAVRSKHALMYMYIYRCTHARTYPDVDGEGRGQRRDVVPDDRGDGLYLVCGYIKDRLIEARGEIHTFLPI